MNRYKVLVIQDELKKYRDPIYSLINEQVDLTVGYTKSTDVSESSYQILSLPYKKIGPFIWHKRLRRIIDQYDVVIFAPYFRMIRIAILPFFSHKPKLISWSLGVHASYTRLYDLTKKPDYQDLLYECIQDHCDACIFYMPEPIEYWKKYRGIDENKYFVAHNTVAIAPIYDTDAIERNHILFVGTLYKEKGIIELINCYARARDRVDKLPSLIIVGEGPEKEAIERLVSFLNLEDSIVLRGAIYDESELKKLFLEAIICVSPHQAGLSVLKSLGYGVPFVTHRDAITGGEKSNIIHGKTGIFYDSEEELVDILTKTSTEPEVFVSMSELSRHYYLTEASPQCMAQGVLDAVFFALNKTENECIK